ncbi:MAG: hypothetical protein QXF41_02545, partial [Candidatus Micrarchaeaceae archaeon]
GALLKNRKNTSLYVMNENAREERRPRSINTNIIKNCLIEKMKSKRGIFLASHALSLRHQIKLIKAYEAII